MTDDQRFVSRRPDVVTFQTSLFTENITLAGTIIEKVKFELPDVAHTFQKGHRLMIQIQSSWFPLADRNPQQFVNIYNCDEKDFTKSVIRIYHNTQNASKVILPVLK